MAGKNGAGIVRYLKEAFLFKWNLLFFGGAMAAAALSGAPDVLIPLVAAGELTFLAGLTSLPRYQAAIDAKARAEKHPQLASGGAGKSGTGKVRLAQVINNLESGGRLRFQRLKERCLQMRNIAHGVRGGHTSGEVDEMRTPGLDRLLWVFLRLLFSQQALLRFLEATDENAIRAHLADLHRKEAKAKEAGDDRILRSLTDAIATAVLRLDNYEKAQKNAEFVEVELDRIEGKIQALTEMSVSNQDPDYISSQVDSVADSMTHTEAAIRDLQYITGLSDDMEAAPQILETNLAEVIEA